MTGFDLIIFDCDGTLVDSEAMNAQALSDVLQDCGLDYSRDDIHRNFLGKTLTDTLLILQMETGRDLPDDIGRRYIDRCAAFHRQGLASPVPGALDVVRTCRDYLSVSVGSNGERNTVLRSLKKAGFGGLFPDHHVFTRIQVQNPKPAPDLFLFAAEQMGAAPSRTLVIEDSPGGVLAGKAAGMAVWGFTGTAYQADPHEKTLRQAGADRILDRFIHIPVWLGY